MLMTALNYQEIQYLIDKVVLILMKMDILIQMNSGMKITALMPFHKTLSNGQILMVMD